MISAADLQDRMMKSQVGGPMGQPVTYTPALSGTPASIRAIVRIDAVESLSETGAVVRAQRVEAIVYDSSLATAPLRGDTVTFNSTTYKVADVQRQDQHAYVLSLRES